MTVTKTDFDLIQVDNHEMICYCSDKASGLRAFVALHNTNIGPGMGGCRIKSYPSEAAALEDVLKLSRAMTYKNALAGLDFGGGKALMIIDKPEDKTPERLKALAHRINLLKGSYYGAGDIGSTTDDLRIMRSVTPYLGGLAKEDGGLGDSSVLTGYGVYLGMKATAKVLTGNDSLKGMKVAVQGAGKVGFHLMKHLTKEEAIITTTDVNAQALQFVKKELNNVEIVEGDTFYQQEVDIFSPNAAGGIINEGFAQSLKAKMVVGGANNPLTSVEVGQILADRGILFAPDFMVNCGGVASIATEIEGKPYSVATERTERVYTTTLKVFEYAKANNILPYEAACKLGEERIFAPKKAAVPA